jgi:hypothetical protein
MLYVIEAITPKTFGFMNAEVETFSKPQRHARGITKIENFSAEIKDALIISSSTVADSKMVPA